MAHNHRESQEISLDRNSEHHADRLGGLVDDLLDVSRIPQDRFSFEFGEAELEQIVRDVVDRFSDKAMRAGCTLSVHTAGPVSMRLDRLRIEQVVTNLIVNALKYGPGKPIEVTLEADEQRGRIAVAIMASASRRTTASGSSAASSAPCR